ncbi:hypothetical protein J5N97_002494 [Dioscorea zingiberensis]|uniref:Uncharacterized protein n=1 Tax=Dioscorea zingiberensis TaxID=325984 RepID=A0A9D5HPI7_9LILI|nr:hypothetical protein J5N97_002494 [Dioscorea zingiberensis]
MVILRVRRGKLLPCNVEGNLLGWKYIIREEIRSGERTLPWMLRPCNPHWPPEEEDHTGARNMNPPEKETHLPDGQAMDRRTLTVQKTNGARVAPRQQAIRHVTETLQGRTSHTAGVHRGKTIPSDKRQPPYPEQTKELHVEKLTNYPPPTSYNKGVETSSVRSMCIARHEETSGEGPHIAQRRIEASTRHVPAPIRLIRRESLAQAGFNGPDQLLQQDQGADDGPEIFSETENAVRLGSDQEKIEQEADMIGKQEAVIVGRYDQGNIEQEPAVSLGNDPGSDLEALVATPTMDEKVENMWRVGINWGEDTVHGSQPPESGPLVKPSSSLQRIAGEKTMEWEKEYGLGPKQHTLEIENGPNLSIKRKGGGWCIWEWSKPTSF